MKRMTYSFFLFLFILSGCHSDNEKKCNDSEKTCLFGPIGIFADGGLPNEAFTFDTKFVFHNFSADQQDKVIKAAELIKEVIASEEFMEEILNFTFEGKNQFVDNGGLSNAQIYWRLLNGAEKLMPVGNNQMDLELVLYYEASTTIGYTKPESINIWLNTKYFNNFYPYQVAGNLTHEWLHKLGFGHSIEYTPSRAYSVPYAVGYLMERLAKKHSY